MFIADNGMASEVSKCCVDWLGTDQQVLLVPIDVAYLITMVFGHYPAEVYVQEALEKAAECDFKVSDVSFMAQGQMGSACFHVKFLGLTAEVNHGEVGALCDNDSVTEASHGEQIDDAFRISAAPSDAITSTSVVDSSAEIKSAHKEVKSRVWRAVERYMYRKGGKPRFKSSVRGFNTISGTCPSDIVFNIADLDPSGPQIASSRANKDVFPLAKSCSRACFCAPFYLLLCG
ncbi:MAG TPA: hypothetical protein H9850_09545 [Candidatus Anaerobiospirillum pullistercoris]|uniref:Uncharacterized protein n=1 Tax=Candidatus Anaerobiospirillum pullistercoris TaxID=2838452 RepID=A0A9D1WEG7_9GAMM|nr:hypothetical protein [Candidatus Anaerobiospirillum pullistercoris]